MPRALRARRYSQTAGVLLASLVTVVPLTACGTDDPGDSPASATIDGLAADAAASDLTDQITAALASATEEFGDVGIDLLQLDPDQVSLMYVDPADPGTRHRAQYRDSTWSEPTGTPRADATDPLSPGAVDPHVVQSAIEATPGLLGVDAARLSHVSVSPDDTGEPEYLVALATDTSLGRVTFGPDGAEREVKPPR